MKQCKRLIGLGVLAAFILIPLASSDAQTIRYPGDTDETVKRRAGWIKAAREEKTLEWWGILRPNLAKSVIAEFNKVYPFIRVNFWRGNGEEIATKIEAEHAAGRINLDIALGGEPYNYPRWRKMGMMEPFADIIPGKDKLDPRMYGKFGDWVIPGNNGVTPQYNTDMVSPAEAPKSWEDLLDPKWKGKLGMTRDVKAWTTIAVGEGGWGIERTEQFLKKLARQNIIWGRGHTAATTLLIAGEFSIMVEGYVYHILQFKEKGAPVEWAKVDPVVVTGPSFTLQKKAPHPNTARLFLEWLLSPPGLIAYDKITYYGAASPGSGTRISKALQGLNLVYRTEDIQMKVLELGLIERFSKILGIQ
ncbi:MAG: extracellular solute-binding protein [Desulfobacterales bacterium]|nr:extracellular solute-binding protein [Desulfobacterales bacterium]